MAERFEFSGLREIFAKANEEKSGDRLAGIAASSEGERAAAKMALADLPLRRIVEEPLISAAEDEVTRLIAQSWDEAAFAPVAELTVGEFREYLLHEATGEAELHALRWGVTPEMAAAVAKLMSNRDLVLAAARIRNVTRCRNTMGERGVLGIRLQPNHPADDVAGILLAAVEGLFYGCGDAVIGVNPVTDSVQTVSAILQALERLRNEGVPVTYVIAGDGKHAEQIRRRAAGSVVSTRFTGFLHGEDVIGALNAADVYLHPAREEIFPNAVAEAMACGRPAIASEIGGMAELVGPDGQAGLLVRPGDADALAEAVRRCAADEGLRARLGAAARRRIEACFPVSAMVDGYERAVLAAVSP